MGRRCSHCGNNGHNSRTCSSSRSKVGGGLKLFGVQLQLASSSHMKKSFSMDCLSASCYAASPSPSSSSSTSSFVCIDEATEKTANGYLSDGLMGRVQERKKGVPWCEEEHRAFLAGLEKLGKGDWRGISRNFVKTRTPTQVASHAQKYFLRQNSLSKKRRRSSLFDVDGNSQRAVLVSDSYKIKDPLNTLSSIDLNCPKLETSLPQYLQLMPNTPHVPDLTPGFCLRANHPQAIPSRGLSELHEKPKHSSTAMEKGCFSMDGNGGKKVLIASSQMQLCARENREGIC